MNKPKYVVPQSQRAAGPSIRELRILVRTPGRWNDYRAFTEAQRGEAEQWARDHNGTLEDLPE